VKRKIAPRGTLGLAHNCPLWASMIDWQIDRPSPKPPGFVVFEGSWRKCFEACSVITRVTACTLARGSNS
jgi:hypothetical protein